MLAARGALAVHDWQGKALFIGSFLLGWCIWPNANGWSDFLALFCVSFSVAALSILLADVYLS